MLLLSVPRTLVSVRKEIRCCNLSVHTEKAYLDWIYRFLTFSAPANRTELSEVDISSFLSFLAVRKQASGATQKQALHAILFLFRKILCVPVNHVSYIRFRKEHDVPDIFTRDEVKKIIQLLPGEKKLIVSLLYGCGLTLNECLSLRIRDIDTELNILRIRNFRCGKNREVFIPFRLREELNARIETLRYRFMQLSLNSCHRVTLPAEIAAYTPEAARQFEWFYLFPNPKHPEGPGRDRTVLHHRSETFIQKPVRKVLKQCGINKKCSCRTFRHSFAAHLLREGTDIYEIQRLLGHKNIRNTMIYKNILNARARISASPLDDL